MLVSNDERWKARHRPRIHHAAAGIPWHMIQALSLPHRRIAKLKSGDWVGYEGRHRVGCFGTSEQASIRAHRWVNYQKQVVS